MSNSLIFFIPALYCSNPWLYFANPWLYWASDCCIILDCSAIELSACWISGAISGFIPCFLSSAFFCSRFCFACCSFAFPCWICAFDESSFVFVASRVVFDCDSFFLFASTSFFLESNCFCPLSSWTFASSNCFFFAWRRLSADSIWYFEFLITDSLSAICFCADTSFAFSSSIFFCPSDNFFSASVISFFASSIFFLDFVILSFAFDFISSSRCLPLSFSISSSCFWCLSTFLVYSESV